MYSNRINQNPADRLSIRTDFGLNGNFRNTTITSLWAIKECVLNPRRAPSADAGRSTRQAPARTSETLQVRKSRITAHFHAARAGYSTATIRSISAFLPNRLFEWIPRVAKYWFRKRHGFRDYTTHGKGTGIYPIDDRVKISLAGDWGTGTDEAGIVAAAMEKIRGGFHDSLGRCVLRRRQQMKCEKTSWGRKRVLMHR